MEYQEAIKKVHELIEDIKVCMLSTMTADGRCV